MPKVNLTARKLDALKPLPGTRVDYFDDSLPGFCVRVTETGRKTFAVLYRHAGKLRRLTIGTHPPLSLADARTRAKKAFRNVSDGRDPAAEKAEARKAETFAELAGEYLERYARPKKKPKSVYEDERIIDHKLVPKIGGIPAREVTGADVRKLLDEIAGSAPIEANRTLAVIRKIYNWAMSKDIVGNNPCQKIPAPGVEHRRDRILSADEITAFWKALDSEKDSPTASALRLVLVTAQRIGEVRSIEWSEIDFALAWWTIPAEKSKNGLTHRVPLSKQALAILESRKAEAERGADKTKRPVFEYVFPARRGKAGHLTTVQKTVERIRESSGLDFTAHDLRRTAASMMTSMGVPRLTVSKILNHVEPGVTAVYDRHSYDAEKRQALDGWGRKLTTIISGLKEVPREA